MNTYAKKQQKIATITLIGVLGGVCIFLTLSSFGFIAIGPITLTTMHIPVVIAAIAGGPLVGGIVGLIFGLSSMLNAILRPSLLSVAFLNPLLAILPRVLLGVVTGYLYLWFKDGKNPKFAIYLASGLGTLLHTIMVLGGLFLFYQPFFGENTTLAFQAIFAIFLTNGLPEMVMALVFVPPIVQLYNRRNR